MKNQWYTDRQKAVTERHRDVDGNPVLSGADRAVICARLDFIKPGVVLPSGHKLNGEPIELIPGDPARNCEIVLAHLAR